MPKRREPFFWSVAPVDEDGWVEVERISPGRNEPARVRVRPDEEGRLEVREVHLLDTGAPITTARLRAFNLATLEMMIEASTILGSSPGRRRALRAPKGRGYGDAFYERVADSYRRALGRGARPVIAIAEEAGVPRSTASRWVKEARRRDKLGEAKPGKAGEKLEEADDG
jgi:transposase-like protein